MKLILKKRVVENISVESFIFEPTTPLKFLAGQYFCLTLPDRGFPDQFGLMRELSAASAPEDPLVMFTVKKGVTGFKDTLFSLAIGDTVTAEGPYGSFYVNQVEQRKRHLFIAGGVGIAPFRSILTSEKHPRKCTLLYALKGPEDAIFQTDLSSIGSRIPVYRTYTQSNEAADFHGKITKEMILHIPPSDIYWICGSPKMVAEVSNVLEDLGISSKNIKIEKFTGYRDMV